LGREEAWSLLEAIKGEMFSWNRKNLIAYMVGLTLEIGAITFFLWKDIKEIYKSLDIFRWWTFILIIEQEEEPPLTHRYNRETGKIESIE